ncbi:hypothetical protein, partial [Bradyrhizobium sp. JYMT SZCCT0428]|uniref:hypothetical protein n=1 Tax=Bradyrhizobium sp. JYMT SZCCT0428 TaxID=2807673 RepID=UPI001BAB3D4F
ALFQNAACFHECVSADLLITHAHYLSCAMAMLGAAETSTSAAKAAKPSARRVILRMTMVLPDFTRRSSASGCRSANDEPRLLAS